MLFQLPCPNTRWTQPSSSVPYYPQWVPSILQTLFVCFSVHLRLMVYTQPVSGQSFNFADTHKFHHLQGFKNSACCLLWKIPLTFMGGGSDKWSMFWTPPKAHYNITAATFRGQFLCGVCLTTTMLNVCLQPVKVLSSAFCLLPLPRKNCIQRAWSSVMFK